jgi:F-type H+-transporting ATPase subunit b
VSEWIPRARTLVPLLTLVILTPAPALAAGGEDGGLADLMWRVVNLALLLAVLVVFARKPLQAFFRDRRDRIQSELQSAAQLRKEAEERYAKWQRQLVDLDAELERVRATARERAEAEREQILADAHAAAQRIRADAHVAVEQEVRRAREQLRDEASALSIQLASELLEAQVTDTDRDRLLDEFITKIEQPSSTGSGS